MEKDSVRLKKLLIIIPCYNEAGNVVSLYQEIQSLDEMDSLKIDVIFINDSSTDNTLDILQKNKLPHLNLPINLGIGGAVQTGFKFADSRGFDFAVQMDGDGQHPPKELSKLWNAMQANRADIVIGSRFVEKEGFQSSRSRRLGIKLLSTWSTFLTGVKILDITSGFRLLNRRAVKLAAEHYPDSYPEPETVALFAGAGLKITETPVKMRPRQKGVSSIRRWFSLFYMFKVGLGIYFMKKKAQKLWKTSSH